MKSRRGRTAGSATGGAAGRTASGAAASSDTMERVWAGLVRAQRVIVAAVESDLKAKGLPPLAWYDVLLELSRAEHRALRQVDLERRLLFAQSNLSRLIDRMAEAGLVARQPCPFDGRSQFVVATSDGLALRKRIWPDYKRIIDRRIGDRFAPEEASSLARLLDRFLARPPARAGQ